MREMLGYQELNHLIDMIRAGDAAAIHEAQAISVKESRIANQQLRRLESADLTTSPAYQKAEFFLGEETGKNRFSQSKQLEGEDLIRNLETVYDFRSDKTSTVTGERERRAGFDKIMEHIDSDEALTGKERGQLRGFLGSDFWKDFKSTIYKTGNKKDRTPDESQSARDAIAEAASAIQKGATVRQLEDLYDQFKTQNDPNYDIFGVIDTWKELALNA